MNREFKSAWDDVAAYAEQCGGTLTRDGHRFMYAFAAGEKRWWMWAEVNEPRFGARVQVGEESLSVRTWSVQAVERVVASLSVFDLDGLSRS